LTSQNGATYNTAVGRGTGAALTTGSYNTVLGGVALDAETTGGNNVAIGYGALTASNGGNDNIAVGVNAGIAVTTGDNNLFLGRAAGDNVTTGSNNLIIGYNIDAPSATANNQLSIGNLIFGTGIDGTGTTVSSGNIGIGTTPNQKLTVEGTMSLKEQASANADTAGYGQLWVKTATPNQLWFTDDAGTDFQLASLAGAETLSNKRITQRVTTETSSATHTINTDNSDEHHITALALDITSFTTNLSGTPTNGQELTIAVTGTATRAITWGASFASGDVTLPTTTTGTKTLLVKFKIVTAVSSTVWQCIASTNIGA
jgi:hypothetical protein